MAATPSRLRRVLASGAMVGIAGGIVASSWSQSADWPVAIVAGAIAIAGVGLSQKNLLVQSLSRATGWLILLPASLATLICLLSGRLESTAAGLTAASAAALLLARPMLHTEEAMKAFAPIRSRSVFLMGTTLSSMAALLAGLCAVMFVGWDHSFGWGLACLVVAGGYLSAAMGVLRMRAWGVLLSGAMSLLALVFAALLRNEESVALALAAIPGLALGAPIAIARLDNGKPHTKRRIADEVTHFRIAELDETTPVESEEEARPNAARMTI